jgi:hypothetical protein
MQGRHEWNRLSARPATPSYPGGLPWNHALSRRSCPLHRWDVDDAATAELPARSSLAAGRNACRASTVQYMSRRTYHLDVSRLRRRGVRATTDRRLPDSGRCGRGALDAHRATRPLVRIEGSGPPRSRATRRRAATNRSSECPPIGGCNLPAAVTGQRTDSQAARGNAAT